eukprot:358812-Chlamydomonas_euryale.AAC.4
MSSGGSESYGWIEGKEGEDHDVRPLRRCKKDTESFSNERPSVPLNLWRVSHFKLHKEEISAFEGSFGKSAWIWASPRHSTSPEICLQCSSHKDGVRILPVAYCFPPSPTCQPLICWLYRPLPAGNAATKSRNAHAPQRFSSQSQSYQEHTHERYACVERRQKGSSSGQGTVTKATPLRAVLGHPIATPPRQAGRENRAHSRLGPIGIAILPRGAWPTDHATRSHQPFSKQQLPNHRLIKHPSYAAQACESRCVEDVHQLGQPHRCAHLSRWVPSGCLPMPVIRRRSPVQRREGLRRHGKAWPACACCSGAGAAASAAGP